MGWVDIEQSWMGYPVQSLHITRRCIESASWLLANCYQRLPVRGAALYSVFGVGVTRDTSQVTCVINVGLRRIMVAHDCPISLHTVY